MENLEADEESENCMRTVDQAVLSAVIGSFGTGLSSLSAMGRLVKYDAIIAQQWEKCSIQLGAKRVHGNLTHISKIFTTP